MPFPACRDFAVVISAVARSSPSHARRGSKAGTRIEALSRKPTDDFIQHGVFTSEKMGAAADIEKKTIIAVERHQRCETITPVGKALKQPPVCIGIGLNDFHLRMHGASVGNTHSRFQTECFGLFIKGRDALCIVLPVADDQREKISLPFFSLALTPLRSVPAPQNPIGRKMREPDRQDPAAPACGKSLEQIARP